MFDRFLTWTPTGYVIQVKIITRFDFANNKLNAIMELPPEDLYESLENYYNNYKPKEIIDREKLNKNKKYINFALFIFVLGLSIYVYSK